MDHSWIIYLFLNAQITQVFMSSNSSSMFDPDKDSGGMAYFMRGILGIGRSVSIKNDSSKQLENMPHDVTEQQEILQKRSDTIFAPLAQGQDDLEVEWTISEGLRKKRSNADNVEWQNLSSTLTEYENYDDLLFEYFMEDSDHKPKFRVERDITSCDFSVRLNMTVSWTVQSIHYAELENMAGLALKMYLEHYPKLTGQTFTTTNITIIGQTIEMSLANHDLFNIMKLVAQALYDLEEKRNILINSTVYTVSSILLECSTTDDLKPVLCCLCAAYQTCMMDNTTTNNWICKLVDDKFYPFGISQRDETLPPDLEHAAAKITVQSSIPFGNKLVDTIWISVNGLISFGLKFTSFSPTRLPVRGYDLMAVYWSDLDLISSDNKSQVFYQYYSNRTSSNSAIFNKAIQDYMKYAPDNSSIIAISDIIIVTWDDIPPWPANHSDGERVTFQCVIFSDSTVTYALYLYGQGAMHFDPRYQRPVQIGYGRFNLDTSPENYYEFDTVIGNTDLPGAWFFKIGERPNNKRRCLSWLNKNTLQLSAINNLNNQVPACPCSEITAILSVFWIPSLEQSRCYDILPLFGNPGRRCCYRRDNSFGFENRIPLAGSFQLYTPYAGDLRNHDLEDTMPKKWCCNDSNLCEMYYLVRPVLTCLPRTTARSLFFGDPHITTLDNLTYTFNGLGEFTLLEVNDYVSEDKKNVNFILQGRTCTASSNSANGTVFCALALRTTNGATFMVEVSKSGRSMIIFANGSDYTIQFRRSTTFSAQQGGIFLQKVNNSLQVSTLDDIGLSITFQNRIIQFTLELGTKYKNLTKGLVGNFNNNPADDLIFPNGTLLLNTSERNLFFYGWSWAVYNTSVFNYTIGYDTSNYSDPNFVPIFLDEVDISLVQLGEDACGGNMYPTCIFDFVATMNETFAEYTKETTIDFENTETIMSNKPPEIVGKLHQQLTINQTTYVRLNISDPDNDNMTYYVLTQPDSDFDESNSTSPVIGTSVIINITSESEQPIYIAVVVVDSKGLSSEVAEFTIIYCTNCSGHGLCNFNETQNITYPYYLLAVCECQSPWSGDDCEEDKDGCLDIPCPMETTCIDAPAIEEATTNIAYSCSNCPLGFLLDSTGTKCEDKDECVNGSNPCVNADCFNTYGSYLCNCSSGYRQHSPSTCVDINECTDLKSGCPQICVNTPGFYECECEEGFNKTGVMGFSCEKNSFDPCVNGTHNCSYGCHIVSGIEECFCLTGTKVAADGQSCEDIDECKENICSQNCTNTNGSFTCSCYAGYMLGDDGLACIPCPANHYGQDCKYKCECRGRSQRCDSVRGCICQAQWVGTSCDEDVNECVVFPNICKPAQRCGNIPGSYNCTCYNGYNDTNSNGSCYNINECLSPSENECPQTCNDTEGSYICTCDVGYMSTFTNRVCRDIDECVEGTSGCEHICINNNGSFVCQCYLGYILTDDRRTCILDIEPCRDFNVTCAFGCNLVNNSPECYCALGFQLGTDNSSCIDIDECSTNSSLCSDSCINTNGSYNCSCTKGQQLLNDQRNCADCDNQFQWGDTCENLCNCYPKGVQQCSSFSGCLCIDGWSGIHCAEDVNECSFEKYPCPNAHNCNNTAGSYLCTCNNGFQPLNDDSSITCVDIDECKTTFPCDYMCTNTIGSYQCSCFSGFISQGSECQDIDECLVPGLNNCDQQCRNTKGGFACECFPGYVLNTTNRNTCIVNPLSQTCNSRNCSDLCTVESGVEVCACRPGFNLNTTDNFTCSDINECEDAATSLCINGLCQNTAGNFKCTCATGYKLAEDQVTCQACGFGLYGLNCNSNCSCNITNTLQCNASDGTCICYEGWMGPTCSEDVDECTGQNATDCGANASCVNYPGSFGCVCNIGLFRTGDYCEDCDSTHWGQDCRQHCQCLFENTEYCVNTNGTCVCTPGSQGSTCSEDIDECLNNSTCPSALETCNNLNFSYECRCVEGYSRFDPKEQCQDVNECLDPNLNTCEQPKICSNTNGSFTCSCPQGYVDVNGNCQVKFKAFKVRITLVFTYEQTDPRIFDNRTQQFQALAYLVAEALMKIGRRAIGEALLLVKINYFTLGSVIADTDIEIDERHSTNVAADMAKLLRSYLVQGQLTVGNDTANLTKIDYKNETITSSTSLCPIYLLFTTCSMDQECQETNGTVACLLIGDTDRDILIGVAIGVPLFIILVTVVVILIYCCRKKKSEDVPFHLTPPDGSVFSGSLATRRSGSPAESHSTHLPPDYPETDSILINDGSRLFHPEQRQSSISESQYSIFWEDMSKMLEPYKNLHIQRPQFNFKQSIDQSSEQESTS